MFLKKVQRELFHINKFNRFMIISDVCLVCHNSEMPSHVETIMNAQKSIAVQICPNQCLFSINIFTK